MAIFGVSQPIFRRNQGYIWHLKEKLFDPQEQGEDFYEIAFSQEENALIKKWDTNITKLGLLDTSFLYSIFEPGTAWIETAKTISIPLTCMKKGLLKAIEGYPLATFKEIEAVSNCAWEKGNVILEADTFQPEGEDFITALASSTIGEGERSFFKNQYSMVRKSGLTHIFYKTKLVFTPNTLEGLTNLAKREQALATLYFRKPENCSNMFQFAKLLFHNQVLFEKNIFRERIRLEASRTNINPEQRIFSEKIEKIYEKFEEEEKEINATVFSFLQARKVEKVFKPEINFRNTHFKFQDSFSKRLRKANDFPITFCLTEKEGKYYIYWPQKEAETTGKILEDISAFLKFYLTFCVILQTTTKEFFSEMLPENI